MTLFKPRYRPTVPSEVLDSFKELSKQERFAFLSALVKELQLNEALVVSRNIEPRLRRDFMRELPLELALHALSFVSRWLLPVSTSADLRTGGRCENSCSGVPSLEILEFATRRRANVEGNV